MNDAEDGRLIAAVIPRTRRVVLRALVAAPRNVPALAADLGLPLADLREHLAALTAAGLLEPNDDGPRPTVSVRPAGLRQLQADIAAMWTDDLELGTVEFG